MVSSESENSPSDSKCPNPECYNDNVIKTLREGGGGGGRRGSDWLFGKKGDN